MTLTTSTITGRVPLPSDSAPKYAEVVFTLTKLDTEGDQVIPGGAGARFVLDANGDMPAGATLWRNTEGLRATAYRMVFNWDEFDRTRGTVRRTHDAGLVQVGDEAGYTIAQLINNTPLPVPSDTYWSSITQAQYDAAIDAATSAAIDRAAAEAARDEAVLYEGIWQDTVASMLANAALTYANAPAGKYIRDREKGFSWLVQPAISTDYQILHPVTGIRLKVMRSDAGYSVAQWGVRPQQIADTALMQAAVDFALDSGELNLRIPSGHHVFSGLRGFNPSGSARAQRGKLVLCGEGQLGLTETYRGEEVNAFYGTILEIQPDDPSDDGILLASGDSKQRDSTLRDMTVIYGGNGYAVDARYIPFCGFDRVSIRVTSPMGGAVNFEDNWGGVGDHCYFACAEGIKSYANGLRLGRTLFAGNFKFTNSFVENFYDNVFIPAGANFTNIVFDNSPIQKFRRNAIRCEGAIWNLKLRDAYMESSGGLNDVVPTVGASSHIYVAPATGSVINLVIDGGFMLGGGTTESWMTAPFMDLTNVNQVSIRDLKVYRPWQSLLRLNSACEVTIDGIDVQHDASANLPTGPLDMIVRNGSFRCNVELKRATISSTSKLRWADLDAVALSENDGDGLHPRAAVSVGLKLVTVGLGAAYDLGNANPRPNSVLVSATAGAAGAAPVIVRLPTASGRRGGDMRIVHNSPDSTQDVLLRNGAGATNIVAVPPGYSATNWADPVNDKWLVVLSPLSYGP